MNKRNRFRPNTANWFSLTWFGFLFKKNYQFFNKKFQFDFLFYI